MNDYITFKTIDMKQQDAARKQRNADHLEALDLPSHSLFTRLQQWWTRVTVSQSTVTLAERTERLQAPVRVTAECSHTRSGA